MHHLNEANDITEPWFCDFFSSSLEILWYMMMRNICWSRMDANSIQLSDHFNEWNNSRWNSSHLRFFSPFQQVLSVFTLYFVGLCYVWRWCLIQTRNINHNYIIRRFVRAIWLIMTFQLNVIQWVFRHHSVYWPESKVTTWMDICVYYFIIDIKSMICHKSNVNDQIVLHFI